MMEFESFLSKFQFPHYANIQKKKQIPLLNSLFTALLNHFIKSKLFLVSIKRRKKSPKNTPKKHSLFTHPSRALACAHIFILQIKIVVMEQPPNLLPVRVSAVVQALALVAVRVRASVVARISQVLPSRRGSCSYVQFLAPCAPYASAL